jgi:hypothetical protein
MTQPEPLTAEAFAFAFIRIRGAHNPTADEQDNDEEVRPCAWCRLAGEQAAEAAARLTTPDAERAAHAADRERIRSALKHNRGVGLGYTGDSASMTDPFNALSTFVLTVVEALAPAQDQEATR